MKKNKYPIWCCVPCAKRASKTTKNWNKVATFHMGTCDVCGKYSSVTEPRDFGHPKFEEK